MWIAKLKKGKKFCERENCREWLPRNHEWNDVVHFHPSQGARCWWQWGSTYYTTTFKACVCATLTCMFIYIYLSLCINGLGATRRSWWGLNCHLYEASNGPLDGCFFVCVCCFTLIAYVFIAHHPNRHINTSKTAVSRWCAITMVSPAQPAFTVGPRKLSDVSHFPIVVSAKQQTNKTKNQQLPLRGVYIFSFF